MKRTLILIAASALLASCSTTPAPRADPLALDPAPEGTLTVAMTASTGKAAAQTEAFAKWVAQATGKQTRPVTFPDYDSLAAAIAQGVADVAFLPPLAFVRALEQGQPQPLAKVRRAGRTSYRAVIFAAPGSALKSVDDLRKAKNLKAAWVDATSSSGYLFPKAHLLMNGIDPAGLFLAQDFFGSHDEVCRAVLEGRADVGATYSDDPPEAAATTPHGCRDLGETMAELQVISATQSVPNDVLAARQGLPAELAAALREAALKLSDSDPGKQVLADAFVADGFTEVGDEDWAPVTAALDTFKK
jgi:phosphonate transport system substrate-binding protein